MKKALAIIMVMLSLAACSNGNDGKQPEAKETASIPIKQFVDSITTAYPNYNGNEAVIKTIADEFEKWIKGRDLPSALEGMEFRVGGVSEIGGKYVAFLVNEDVDYSLILECEMSDNDALKIDKGKLYKVAGGTVGKYDADDRPGTSDLPLGTLTIKDSKIEEIPGKKPKTETL